ncbi:MAG TPA: sulfotransferase [Candidatus Rubrimentiphilum sp.]|nr:sulfotransferase [Candidatus Rubrimentiphilum sp.]
MKRDSRSTRPPLIVTGMHRSGTSFVSSLLREAGLDVGTRLMAASRGNERGHFENLDFVEFHRRWLRLTGHDDSGLAASGALTLPADAVAEARDILAANARNSGWGWKDPRTTIFLDFWANLAPEACYVFVYREPSEVVDSVFRRKDESIRLSPELAAQAYLKHNKIILQFARANRSRCVIANVSEVARNPDRFLAMVAQRSGLHLNLHASSPFDPELLQVIEPGSLRPALLRYVLPQIESVYSSLEREADLPGGLPQAKRPSAKSLREAFLSEWCLYSGWIASRDAGLASRQSQIDEMRTYFAEAEARNAARDAELALRQSQIDQVRAYLAEAEAGTAARDAELALRQSQIDELRIYPKIQRGLARVLDFFHLTKVSVRQ